MTATAAIAPIAYLFGLSQGGEEAGEAASPDETALAKLHGLDLSAGASHQGAGPAISGLAGAAQGEAAGKIARARAEAARRKANKRDEIGDGKGGPLEEVLAQTIARDAGRTGPGIADANAGALAETGAQGAAPATAAFALTNAGGGGGSALGAPSINFGSLPNALVTGPIEQSPPPPPPPPLVTPLPGSLPLLLTGLAMFGFAARARR
ncbi:MAG: hypothetical protein GC153_00670 [Alphaproteobacteria bacterium]|nr:hypothetical protein [Alphaproteobacteria bacterium]